MGTYRLNLSALRRRSTSHGSSSRAPRGRAESLTLSRREMLGLAGAAAIGLSPVAKAVEAGTLGAFQCSVGKKRVAFRLEGVERWVIDTRRFGGSPDLSVKRSDGLIQIALSRARYPGTELPADLACELRRGMTGWKMTLRMKLGGFRATVPFEAWLAGLRPAESGVKLDGVACRLDDSSSLNLNGDADAEFRPDWSLTLSGAGIASLQLPAAQVQSDRVRLALLKREDESFTTKPAAKRSLVVLQRGKEQWDRGLFLECLPEEWRAAADESPFDCISMELGEHKTGLPQRTLLAESVGDQSRLRVHTLADSDFALPLSGVRYSTTFGKTENQQALMARYGEPAWLDLDGCSVMLGDSPDTPDFEVTRVGKKERSVTCVPGLLALVAPLIGATTTTATPTKPTSIDISGRQPIKRVPPPSSTTTTVPPTTDKPPTITKPPVIRQPIKLPPDTGKVLKPDDKIPPTLVMPMNLKISVVRPSDLLCLEFEFVNLRLQSGSPLSLTRSDPKSPAYIIVHFPPQNIAEKAFYETAPSSADNEPPTPAPIPAVMSGPSRLAFRIPDNMASVPYTLAGLLAWHKLEPSLVPVALPPHGGYARNIGVMSRAPVLVEKSLQANKLAPALRARFPGKSDTSTPVRANISFNIPAERLSGAARALLRIQEPTETQTLIEAPYRLMLSPHAGEGWAHSAPEVTRNGQTELWHTRLGMRVAGEIDENDTPFRTVRPIWSPDYNPKTPPGYDDLLPFRMSLCKRDRCEIVGLSSNYQTSGYEPTPAHAKQFMLTSLGVWMDTHALWNPKKLMYNTSEWKHTATMGRDHYVKVVAIGYLFPFGQLAVRTTITERKFEKAGNRIGAYNKQIMFITVLKPVVEYPAMGADDMMTGTPFKRIQCTTMVTPNLGKPESSAVPGTGAEAFWPVYGTDVYKFHFTGEDWDGKHAEFEAPVIFTMFSTAFDAARCGKVGIEYGSDANKERRKVDFSGQKIAFAESGDPGDTSYEAFEANLAGNVMDFGSIGSVVEQMKEEDHPPFYPTLASANVTLPQLRHLVGNNGVVEISYNETYKSSGFANQNKGEVWANIKEPIPLGFGGSPDKSVGVASPDMSIGGISRTLGPVGGAADSMAAGSFDPTQFFKGAKVLGCIELVNIIDAITDFGNVMNVGTKVPVLKSIPIYESGKTMPSAIESRIDWQTSGISDDKKTETFLASANGKHASLSLSMVKRTALDGGESSTQIVGELSNFTVQLVPKIMHLCDVVFNYLRFTSENGKKPDVKADIDKIRFKGPLMFINPLEEFLGGAGFSDPPYLEVNSERILAGFTLPIPTIGVGVFALQNLSLGAELKIPFIGDPVSLKFLFCDKHNPFLVSVSIFGGGGYFGLAVDPDGVKSVEGSLEFGGTFALGLGVASGAVYLMAGVAYFHSPEMTKLSGYLRCGGALNVLGLITVSLEFIMSLDYYPDPSRLYGVATLTVEIEILFFSKSVELTCERQFAGGGDPGFTDLMSVQNWNDYCDAFAA